ncbi:hypothetical protein M1N67_04185, partial [Peptococcaceae bacterium]|nr:hypothetical protein [Peptococcaceae bacterium]
LKSLILLTYVKKFYNKISRIKEGIYHNPLLLTLVNSINTIDADLKLFFREIEKIGKGDIKEKVFNESCEELWEELKEEPDFDFEDGRKMKIDEKVFKNISLKDVLKNIYNSDSPGEIEISFRPSDKKQVAFKLTTSDKHFALIKTGDMPSWLKKELNRFNINHQFEEEGLFERINRDDSPINILMGSRAFYEGWDSNRPNIINFINIGTGIEAKKFILQSVGRGIRIEPLSNKRRRLLELYNDKNIDDELFNRLKDLVIPIETLFVFGTNRNALLTVIKELKQEKKERGKQLSLFINKSGEKHNLLIPVYKLADYPLMKKRGLAKFETSKDDLELLQKYADYVSDGRIFLMNYDTTPEKIKILKETLNTPDKYYKYGERSFKNINIFVQRIFDYFSVIPEELKEFKRVEDEIRHFKSIKVHLEDLSEIQTKIELMKDYPDRVRELDEQYGKIPRDEYSKKERILSEAGEFKYNHKKIRIKYIANHYYIPMILTDEERIDYINHIIKTPSEAKFISKLEKYLSKDGNKFNQFDWWFFSKLDEILDEVYIPYYHPDANRISKFNPDFIFWLKKDNNYFIVFIVPKGIKHTDYMHKVDGYKMIFEEDDSKPRKFEFKDLTGRVYTFLCAEDINRHPQDGYGKYWFDSIDKALTNILKIQRF